MWDAEKWSYRDGMKAFYIIMLLLSREPKVTIMCRNDELSGEFTWLFTNRLRATRYMNFKRIGITEILRRVWLFSANKIKSSESGSKQPTQLIVQLNSSLWHIIVTFIVRFHPHA